MPTDRPKIFMFARGNEEGPAFFEAAGCEVALGSADWANPTADPPERMVALARDADALVGTSIKNSRIDRDVMTASETLRIISKYTVGVDEIDVDTATELGILVTHAPTEANWGGVAEYTVTLMLTMLKKMRERDRWVKETGAWRDLALTGTYLGRREDGYGGITIGIIGLGRIGTRVSKLMRPWDLRIVAYDPYVADAHFAELGVERMRTLDGLLEVSDVVSVHVTLTKETRHMLSAAQFNKMKHSAVLVNTARGPAVDEEALIDALRTQRIAGAALDVMEHEPISPDNPLLAMDDRVFLSPHMAAHNHGAGIGPGIVWGNEDVLRALRGQVPEHIFNPEALSRWRERFEGRSLL